MKLSSPHIREPKTYHYYNCNPLLFRCWFNFGTSILNLYLNFEHASNESACFSRNRNFLCTETANFRFTESHRAKCLSFHGKTGFVCFRHDWAVIDKNSMATRWSAAPMICTDRLRVKLKDLRGGVPVGRFFSLYFCLLLHRGDVLHLLITSRFTFLFVVLCVCEWQGCSLTWRSFLSSRYYNRYSESLQVEGAGVTMWMRI